MLEHVHIKLDAGLKRRAEEAADKLELRNLSAFVRMAVAEKVNAVLGEGSHTVSALRCCD